MPSVCRRAGGASTARLPESLEEGRDEPARHGKRKRPV